MVALASAFSLLASPCRYSVRGCSDWPRVRGNPSAWASRNALRGSIPARAGEPKAFRIARVDDVVYPRRVRGNRKPSSPLSRTRGSIPARAGEPFMREQPLDHRKVYPRACGGNPGGVTGRRGGGGGSIPARAGEPFSILPSSGKPSARVGYRDRSNRAFCNCSVHPIRQQQQVRHDGTQADLFRRSVDTSRSPAATRKPVACASAL